MCQQEEGTDLCQLQASSHLSPFLLPYSESDPWSDPGVDQEPTSFPVPHSGTARAAAVRSSHFKDQEAEVQMGREWYTAEPRVLMPRGGRDLECHWPVLPWNSDVNSGQLKASLSSKAKETRQQA